MKTTPLIVCLVLTLSPAVGAAVQESDADPFAGFTRAWRDDPVWYDGKAECAVYDATRTVYGKERRYTARIYTDKEVASPVTFTKSADGTGRAVFKHHVRDDIPTENYTYYYSTMVYVGTDDLKSLKLDMGSQEDCGATFKQYVNHAGSLSWDQFSYFPNEGHKRGGYTPAAGFVFQDALSLVLRGYPFDDPPDTLHVDAVPDQTNTRLSESRPLKSIITYEGVETLELPIGEVRAHHVRFYHDEFPKGEYRLGIPQMHDYWFAADPALRHVMVQYRGPDGQSYRLRAVERRAYWR